MEQVLNHTKLANMVKESVGAALVDHDNIDSQQAEDTEQLKQQVKEMRTLPKQINVANAVQQSQQPSHQPEQQMQQYYNNALNPYFGNSPAPPFQPYPFFPSY